MDTDVREYQAALATLKQAAAPFAALSKLFDVAAPLLAVVNHEAELRAKIESLKADVADWTQKASDARAAEESALAEAKAEHEKYVAEYAAHREKLRAEALAVESECAGRITSAKQAVEDVLRESIAEIDTLKADADRKREAITADLIAFQGSAETERARITAQTTALQTQLDELKGKVSGLLA